MSRFKRTALVDISIQIISMVVITVVLGIVLKLFVPFFSAYDYTVADLLEEETFLGPLDPLLVMIEGDLLLTDWLIKAIGIAIAFFINLFLKTDIISYYIYKILTPLALYGTTCIATLILFPAGIFLLFIMLSIVFMYPIMCGMGLWVLPIVCNLIRLVIEMVRKKK